MSRIIWVPGCSVCKKPYDFHAGIKYDETKTYMMLPTCPLDEKHPEGYTDILIKVSVDVL